MNHKKFNHGYDTQQLAAKRFQKLGVNTRDSCVFNSILW
jgi:hypothetical protein